MGRVSPNLQTVQWFSYFFAKSFDFLCFFELSLGLGLAGRLGQLAGPAGWASWLPTLGVARGGVAWRGEARRGMRARARPCARALCVCARALLRLGKMMCWAGRENGVSPRPGAHFS